MTTPTLDRRHFLAAGAATLAGTGALAVATQQPVESAVTQPSPVIVPPAGKRYLLSCKLGMVAKELNGKALSLTERLTLAKDAGFDGIDLDEAGSITEQEARQASIDSGLYIHNAINHDHWKFKLTSASEQDRAKGIENLEHCIRVSHAAGGSGVLLVVGHANDGSEQEVADRSRAAIQGVLPLAASLGQHMLFENVWSGMFYDHNAGPEQSGDRWAAYVDSFNSPWVGMYYDIGNHWKYGQPGDWIRTFGKRIVKMDLKGFDRSKNSWADIGEGDLPWGDVRAALDEIGFTGWFTAEVGGGGPERLAKVLADMKRVLELA